MTVRKQSKREAQKSLRAAVAPVIDVPVEEPVKITKKKKKHKK